jgi:tetratricopeptide (TPR) repeat protein
MTDDHLTRETVERALRGEIAPAEVIRELLRHLLDVCPRCRRAWREVALPQGRAAADALAEGAYGLAFERALAAAERRRPDLERERTEAAERVAELAAASEARQLALLRDDPRFATWGVCDLLINESYRAAFEDPGAAEGLARLALELAARLDPALYGGPFLADVRSLAWAYLGNARRVGSDLAGAEEALGEAERLRGQGAGDPLTRAQVANLLASLRRAQRRFGESRALLEEVAAIYREVGDRHMEGRTLVKQAHTLRVAGEPAAALPLLERALERIDPGWEPRLDLCARHNLASTLIDLGRCREAADLLAENRERYRRFGDFSTRLRRRWLEGRLAACLEDGEAAEAAFREVRQGFIDHGVGYDAALVSLDLAGLFAARGRGAEVRALAEEMLPIFRSRDVHREALAALLVFQQAARAEAVTVALVERIASYLRHARHDPGYRFEEPS